MSMTQILIKALTNTLLGMGTVFTVLIFISLIIALLPKITALIEGKNKKEEIVKLEIEEKKEEVTEIIEEEFVDDLELVAVITAAIAASEGVPADGFVVRSIKKSTNNKWKRA